MKCLPPKVLRNPNFKPTTTVRLYPSLGSPLLVVMVRSTLAEDPLNPSLFCVRALVFIYWGRIVNIGPKHTLFPRKTQPTSRNGKPQGRWEGTSNKLKGPVCIQQTHTQAEKWKDGGPDTPKANVLEGIIIVLTCFKKRQGGGLKLNKPCGGRCIFISLSRLTFPLK